MTSAGGGEPLNNKSPPPTPPSPIGGRFKNSMQSRPPHYLLNRFLILKNALNQHNISFQIYFRNYSLNCCFHVKNNAQSQITLIKYVIFACNLTLCVKYDLKTAI
jgi:hypothetical protein